MKKKKKKKKKEEERIFNVDKFNEWVNKQETSMNAELFKKHLNFQRPSDMLKFLYKTNTSQNNELVSLINSGLIVEKLKRCPKNKEKLKSQIR